LAVVVGFRAQQSAHQLIERTAYELCGQIPLFVSDGLDSYAVALPDRYHVRVLHSPTGKLGSPRSTKKPHPDLRYAQVVKKR